MKVIKAVLAVTLLFGANNAFAQKLTLGASVKKACTVGDVVISGAVYDPASATDLKVDGSMLVQCTKGIAYNIDLGNGGSYDGTTRRLNQDIAGTLYYLNYQLLDPNGAPWPAAPGLAKVSPGAGGDAVAVSLVVAAAQDQPAGNGAYADEVSITVNM